MGVRKLPNPWRKRHGPEPVPLETFVESLRHQGTCCKAANRTRVAGAGSAPGQPCRRTLS
jgi:hypothetical protein